MNNLKKLGVSALAGSLAVCSANAADVSVTGSLAVTYTNQDNSETTGNPMGMDNEFNFNISGEMDNGMGVSYFMGMGEQAGGMDSAKLTVDMGDMGKIAFDQGSGSGLANYDDMMPKANEEVWDGLDTTGSGLTASGMTIEFRTDASSNIITPVRILNMGSGFAYGDTITIPDTVLGAGTNGGNVTFTLDHPTDAAITAANTTEITSPGGLFSGNPPGAVLSSVSQLDVLNVKNSIKMLTAVDGALVRIDLERSDLGATMSRMEHTISNLSNIVMNTKAARSRINDADIALESTELSKAQVLNQAAQAMLAQANKAQQSILQLLN